MPVINASKVAVIRIAQGARNLFHFNPALTHMIKPTALAEGTYDELEIQSQLSNKTSAVPAPSARSFLRNSSMPNPRRLIATGAFTPKPSWLDIGAPLRSMSPMPSAPRRLHNTTPSVLGSPSILRRLRAGMTIEEMVAGLSSLEKKCLQDSILADISYGSISQAAHETLAEACNRMAMAILGVSSIEELKAHPSYVGPRSGSGEGGELPERDNTVRQSMGRQIASGRFGVTSRYVNGALVLVIKIVQGAKPADGGKLPGKKVNANIAAARGTEVGIDLISPGPMHDLYSIEDLKQLIQDLRNANPNAKIAVKLGSCPGVGVIACGVVKCGADMIIIAGPGGTGAATYSAQHEMVYPVELGIAEAHQTLLGNGLRDRVSLIASGTMQSGLDAFKMRLIGADGTERGRFALSWIGCVNSQKCQDNTCVAGIATGDQALVDAKYKGKPEDVARGLIYDAIQEAEECARYGFTDPKQARGRTDLLKVEEGGALAGLEELLKKQTNPHFAFAKRRAERAEDSNYTEKMAITRIANGERELQLAASNQIVSFGARISWQMLNDPTFAAIVNSQFEQRIKIQFVGDRLAMGQSFGFLPPPIDLVTKHANDGTGKCAQKGTRLVAITAGNQTGYGAKGGDIFMRFSADRTGVLNSGANIVTEMIGQMGANFMTGGRMTILGDPACYEGLECPAYKVPVLLRNELVGPNFASGWSGGLIYLPKKLYRKLHHQQYLSSGALPVTPQDLDEEEGKALHALLQLYNRYLDSALAKALVEVKNLEKFAGYFVKLDPKIKMTAAEMQKLTDSIEKEFANTEGHHSGHNLENNADFVNQTNSDDVRFIPFYQRNPVLKFPPSAIAAQLIASKSEVDVIGDNKGQENSFEKDACGTGVLMDRTGEETHETVRRSTLTLSRFMGRGATGVDTETGDGCGIAFYGLHKFFSTCFAELQLTKGDYGVIHVGFSNRAQEGEFAQAILNGLITELGLHLAGQRNTPVDTQVMGYLGQQQSPSLQQWVVLKPQGMDQEYFEKVLVLLRLRFELIMQKVQPHACRSHILSASSYFVIYKALVRENRFAKYFLDVQLPEFMASAAVVHARFSTNTLPSPLNIQPFSFANNGECNALQLLTNILCKFPMIKTLLGVPEIDLSRLSDSHIMSYILDVGHLLGFSLEEMIAMTIQPYQVPGQDQSSLVYELKGSVPFRGPNATLALRGTKVIAIKDTTGWRPLRGLLSEDGKYAFMGSELGALNMLGDVMDLPPGRVCVLDLATGEVKLWEPTPQQQAYHRQLVNRLKRIQPPLTAVHPIVMTPEELELRKLRVNWAQELNEAMIEPQFNGQVLTTSMGDQGPIEALVPGGETDLRNFIKAFFAQVTNPPMARGEELAYMTTQIWVGPLEGAGYLLPSPIIDNQMLDVLCNDPDLQVQTVDILYPIDQHGAGLQAALARIADDCVTRVRAGAQLLVLSDLRSDKDHAGIPSGLVSAVVHDRLMRAGLRHSVKLVLQAAEVLIGRDVAQVIGIGGIDIVNPYLLFVPDAKKPFSAQEFRKRSINCCEALRMELLAFMARIGISSVEAYRGAKTFGAIGLSADVAAILGIQNIFSKESFEQVARMISNRHRFPNANAITRYGRKDEGPRISHWPKDVVRDTIALARGELSEEQEIKLNKVKKILIERGQLRGLLRLKTPLIWNEKNPMRVCIVGGGAAGFNMAQALLESKLPVLVTIIEARPSNRVGFIGDGVAPDHQGTKKQGEILTSILDDERLQYLGGIEVGDGQSAIGDSGRTVVSWNALRKRFPCIIDARGAGHDISLGIPGETTIPRKVMPASVVHMWYNNSPFCQTVSETPFLASKNMEIAIVGSGNVAADITRLFCSDYNQLADDTSISPAFVDFLMREQPRGVHLFARGAPHKIKMDLKQIVAIANLPTVVLSADFELDPRLDVSSLQGEELALHQFFSKIRNNPSDAPGKIQVHFHFQTTPQYFVDCGDEVQLTVKNSKSEVQDFRFARVITAIGREAVPPPFESERLYTTGWAAGRGGALGTVKAHVEKTLQKIQSDFAQGIFHHHPVVDVQQWERAAPFDKNAFRRLLRWLADGNPLITAEDYLVARSYGLTESKENSASADAAEAATVTTTTVATPTAAAANAMTKTLPDPDAITARSVKGEAIAIHLDGKTAQESLLKILQTQAPQAAPPSECEGDLVCAKCKVQVEPPIDPSVITRAESQLLKATGEKAGNGVVLSCVNNRPASHYLGRVITPLAANAHGNTASAQQPTTVGGHVNNGSQRKFSTSQLFRPAGVMGSLAASSEPDLQNIQRVSF